MPSARIEALMRSYSGFSLRRGLRSYALMPVTSRRIGVGPSSGIPVADGGEDLAGEVVLLAARLLMMTRHTRRPVPRARRRRSRGAGPGFPLAPP